MRLLFLKGLKREESHSHFSSILGKLKVNSWGIYVLGFRVWGLGYLPSILGELKVNFLEYIGIIERL